MPVSDECFDCLISRVAQSCALAGRRDEAPRVGAICAARLAELREDPVPLPVVASELHRLAIRELGAPDPYAGVKAASTEAVLAALRAMQPRLATFRDLVTASIIGNTFDHGVKGHAIAADFAAFFQDEFARGLAIDHCDEMERRLDRVVYITDNCGEIVLDRLLIRHLVDRGARVTVAVRDGPILNDATLDDARALGLDRLAECLTTTGGGSEIGVPLDRIPSDLAEAIDHADLVIAKGMANYESLSESGDLPPVAFLLAAKCRPIAARLGVAVGEKAALLRS
jgi:damage-control phosphatase, subfamily I